ncbi:hypothetical protein [Aneurinibacillus uraniidurans]|uniref:hypothetical protein n=1 Tax=Aneurinibacillus uraniidurans TaxID=2966586 RepID=UPI00234B1697|nr:hypothetical protein [Aneurinibacillus sp. B1]WCN37018.1 hypothetical protein PO771_14305 [Aneurinibacillus sp. B1]
MKDPWNPTHEEIIEWAYDKDSLCEQDWDLAITDMENADVLLSLASDSSCPSQSFFLNCIYLLVGDAIRSKKSVNEIIELLNRAEKINEPHIRKWIERSKVLIEKPETFNYELWCDGGFAYRIDNQARD